MLTNKEISNIQITWKTLSFPEIKSRLQELYHSDMSFLDLVSALYWDLIETKHKYYYGSAKFGSNRATLEEIAELKDELNGWQEDPFSIIAEVCGAVTDCRRCQWYEKCPLPKNCGGWKLSEDWRGENGKMEIVFDYDDKTGTWSEAPEAYGTIECATKEDYEYAKKAIKGYIELEAKHWDECRQIAHYDNELKDLREENKVLIRECDRLIKEKGELLSKVSGGDVLRICQLEEQLEEAKRLLKVAVENMNDGGCTRSCSTCKYGRDGCKYTEGYEWIHTDEALKLIGGETDEQI